MFDHRLISRLDQRNLCGMIIFRRKKPGITPGFFNEGRMGFIVG